MKENTCNNNLSTSIIIEKINRNYTQINMEKEMIHKNTHFLE